MQQQCKRNRPRLEHGNLIVKVKKTGLLSRMFGAKLVSWLDYHQQGIAFISDQRYPLDSQVELDLIITDNIELQASNIVAYIKNRQKRPEGFRYGLEFDFNCNTYMRSPQVKTKLADIEQLLKDIYFRLTGKTHFRVV